MNKISFIEAIIRVIQILKPSPHSFIVKSLVGSGIVLSTHGFWQNVAQALIEKYFDILLHIPDTSFLGVSLLSLGILIHLLKLFIERSLPYKDFIEKAEEALKEGEPERACRIYEFLFQYKNIMKQP